MPSGFYIFFFDIFENIKLELKIKTSNTVKSIKVIITNKLEPQTISLNTKSQTNKMENAINNFIYSLDKYAE